ncbi:MAG: 6,7-dimethyl-8-ribityllumazine synthase [Bacteroidaceae bacterium]|nr:6,7-dimethyl-8-ribityllumazine synthase [Bacteroidaceae bacterium]
MATAYHHLSDYDAATVPSAEGMRVAIVVADWNDRFTYAMADAAIATLKQHGVKDGDILVKHVPGSFELIYGATWAVEHAGVDAVIAIGCVIRGDTPHFDYICQGTTQGLAELNLRGRIPVIYGLLTCNTMEQAEARTGGILGNKGTECAVTAIKMVDYGRHQSSPE